MTIATATISGQLDLPDLTGGSMTVTLEAYADASIVTYPGMVIGGKIGVPIANDGTASVTIPKIPQAGLLPSTGVQWHAQVRVGGAVRDYYFSLTADTTWDTVLTPGNALSPPSLLGDALAAAAAAQAAAASVAVSTWQPSTSVVASQVVKAPSPDGSELSSNSARTTRATFDATEQTFWTPVVTKSGTMAQLALDALNTTMRAPAGDATAALNTFLAGSTPGVKKLIGAFTISGSVTVPAGVTVDATGATITTSLTTTSSIIMGANTSWLGGSITGPASWSGTNTGATMTFAMIWVTGNNVTVDDVSLTNIYKTGVGIVDHSNVTVSNCHFVGNYPSGSWTGVETNHFAIFHDPDTNGTDLVVTDNIIESSVQGVFIGNYGLGIGESATVTGNLFKLIWNHGVYGYGSGYSVSGNAFHRCQIPIALSGSYHSATGNTCYTGTTGGSDQRDYTGISMRDSVGCTVTGNTIRGNGPTASNIISFTAVDGVIVRDNVCADNTIDVVGGTNSAISMGTSATTCENNTIHDNHIRAIGRANLGVITVASTSTSIATKVHDNTIVMLGNSHGILISNSDGAIVHDNHIRLEFDSGGAITLGMVAISNSTNAYVHDNEFRVSASWGTNVSLRAVYEVATVTNSRIQNNSYQLNPTKLAAATPISIITSGNALLNEFGVGVPALAAAPGSQWRRTDSTVASTVVYFKETASSSTTWRAV